MKSRDPLVFLPVGIKLNNEVRIKVAKKYRSIFVLNDENRKEMVYDLGRKLWKLEGGIFSRLKTTENISSIVLRKTIY